MKEVVWKYWRIGRLKVRTNNIGLWLGIEWRLKDNKGLYDVTISKKGINFQWLPF